MLKLGKLSRVDDRGLFEGKVKGKPKPLKYRCRADGHEWWVTDPYSFGPVLGPLDDLLIAQGSHFRLFDKLGVPVAPSNMSFGASIGGGWSLMRSCTSLMPSGRSRASHAVSGRMG